MNEDVMVIPLRVPREVGRAWKLEAVKQDKSVQKWILEQMKRTILVHTKPEDPARKPVSRPVAPVPSRPGSTLKLDPFSGEPREVPMKKCSKCFDVFPVADMVTDPKSGKLFCGSCVENMRNSQ